MAVGEVLFQRRPCPLQCAVSRRRRWPQAETPSLLPTSRARHAGSAPPAASAARAGWRRGTPARSSLWQRRSPPAPHRFLRPLRAAHPGMAATTADRTGVRGEHGDPLPAGTHDSEALAVAAALANSDKDSWRSGIARSETGNGPRTRRVPATRGGGSPAPGPQHPPATRASDSSAPAAVADRALSASQTRLHPPRALRPKQPFPQSGNLPSFLPFAETRAHFLRCTSD